jgi:hypothetical protein
MAAMNPTMKKGEALREFSNFRRKVEVMYQRKKETSRFSGRPGTRITADPSMRPANSPASIDPAYLLGPHATGLQNTNSLVD